MNLSGKTVFLTGGNGFLGRQIARILIERGAQAQTVRSADCDLRSFLQAWRAIDQIGPDLVIHAAAKVGGILANKRAPYQFGRDNLAMGMSVLDACIRVGVPKLVVVGSTCSYAAVPSTFPFSEDSLWEGYPEETNAPYGIAKRTLGMLVKAAVEEGKLKSGTMAILSNMYGPGDNFHPETSHTIPALIRRFCNAVDTGETEVENWGSGRATRDFLHVRDAAEGIVRVCEGWHSPEPVNLGTGKEVSIADLSTMLAEIIGFKGRIKWAKDGLDGQVRRALDCGRAWAGLGWMPGIDFRAGLEEVVQWWRENRHEHA